MPVLVRAVSASMESEHFEENLDHYLPPASIITKGRERLSNLSTTKELESRALSTVLNSLLFIFPFLPSHF